LLHSAQLCRAVLWFVFQDAGGQVCCQQQKQYVPMIVRYRIFHYLIICSDVFCVHCDKWSTQLRHAHGCRLAQVEYCIVAVATGGECRDVGWTFSVVQSRHNNKGCLLQQRNGQSKLIISQGRLQIECPDRRMQESGVTCMVVRPCD